MSGTEATKGEPRQILHRMTPVDLTFRRRLRLLFGGTLHVGGIVESPTPGVEANLTIYASINGLPAVNAAQYCSPSLAESEHV